MQGYSVSSAQLAAGIAFLFFGGEFFVSGSVALSSLFGIPQIIIGLTIVAMGTSAPELFVSMLSTIYGNMGIARADNIAVSNIIGSNIFNILIVLVLVLGAVVFPLRVQSRLLRRELPLLLSISVAV
jgi:cation:H+ antiporter